MKVVLILLLLAPMSMPRTKEECIIPIETIQAIEFYIQRDEPDELKFVLTQYLVHIEKSPVYYLESIEGYHRAELVENINAMLDLISVFKENSIMVKDQLLEYLTDLERFNCYSQPDEMGWDRRAVIPQW